WISIAGLIFDLLIVPLLIWRRTRTLAIVLMIGFHLTNAWMFHIGIFPWLSIALTTLFFEPDWPRRVWKKLKRTEATETKSMVAPTPFQRKSLAVGLASYVLIQILLPLRQYLYSGDPAWTEEGHLFSWRMKLRGKEADADFIITDPVSKKSWPEDGKYF